jgi:FeS assembly SUF system protein
MSESNPPTIPLSVHGDSVDGAADSPAPKLEMKLPPITPLPADAPPAPCGDPVGNVQRKLLEGKIIEAVRTVYDPEIPINIHELGLIYGIDIDPNCNVTITMTLTSPMCPVAGSLPGEVETKVRAVEGVSDVTVNLVWEPAWSRELMSEAALLQLGLA